jgi:hypothetical protein
LSLPEDRPEFFQILMDYIFSGGENERNLKTYKFGTWKGCIAFMEYAEVYDLAGAVVAITGYITGLLERDARGEDYPREDQIRTLFRVLPEGHYLQEFITKNALRHGLASGRYAKLGNEVQGFAAETLHQFRMSRFTNDEIWLKYPVTGERVEADLDD